MEQPVRLPETLLVLTLYSACGLYFLQSDIQRPAALLCATGAIAMAALLLHHTMRDSDRTRRPRTRERRSSDPSDGARHYIQVERESQRRERNPRITRELFDAEERRSDRTIGASSSTKPRLVVTNEEFISALRSQELSADIHYRRCKEEKKWALSQGNKARAFQLSSQVKRYAELKENLRREIEYQSSKGKSAHICYIFYLLRGMFLSGSQASYSRTIDMQPYPSTSDDHTSTARSSSRSPSKSSDSDATIRPDHRSVKT